jgi:hypothetical protein
LDPEQGSPKSKKTLVHGFHAAMGGFAIQSHFLDTQYPITSQGRLTLSTDGVCWLLQMAPEVFPDLSEDEILDKSKASTLVKALTCLQAFWFCLQCVARLTMHTSISLLELNVFGHCICTFVIYAIWWNKPMDVSEPVLLRSEDRPEFRSLIALLCSYSSREVPLLPSPLDEYLLRGEEYTGYRNARTPYDNISLSFQPSRQTQSAHMSYHHRPPEDQSYSHQYSSPERCGLQVAHHYGDMNAQFDDMDSSDLGPRAADENVFLNSLHSYRPQSSYQTHDSEEHRYIGERGPQVCDDEEQIDEFAGLRIERLVQLLNLDESDPQM